MENLSLIVGIIGVIVNIVGVACSGVFAFIGVIFALWYENLGAPRLSIEPYGYSDAERQSGWRARFLHLKVKNIPRRHPFVPRRTAESCHGTITFFTPDYEQVGKMVPIRWDNSPEPLKWVVLNNRIVSLPENSLIRVSRYIDIPPDEAETFAIAGRNHGDAHAYAWGSDNYRHQRNNWRHPDYDLPPGKYIARIRLIAGGHVFQKEFPLQNPDEFEEFRLVS